MHDAGPLGTVSQTLGVTQFVDGLFDRPFLEQSFIRRVSVELRPETGQGYEGRAPSHAGLAEDEIEVWGVEVQIDDPKELVPWDIQ